MSQTTYQKQQTNFVVKEKTSFRQTIQDILYIMRHSDTSTAIHDGLARVLSFYGADKVYIGYFDETNSCLTFLHEISADGKVDLDLFLETQFQGARVLYEKDLPWWVGNIKKGIDTVLSDVREMPESACHEQYLMIKNKLKSTLSTSIYSNGEVKGFMGVEFSTEQHIWTEIEIENIHFFADLFAIVIENHDMQQLLEYELELINAREANKIKDAFIKNLSHELRTPLNVIVGFSNVLAANNNTEENSYFIDIINKNNQILLQIINSILNFSEIESGAMQYTINTVDLKEICQEAVNIKGGNWKEHIQFYFDENQPSVLIRTDRDRIIQALFHLIDNAYKFTEEGTITLGYSVVCKNIARIELEDTGIGMEEEEISKLFMNFYKANEFQIGLGLGLCIAKKIVEDLGGCVGVESVKGKGSKFWLDLPLNN